MNGLLAGAIGSLISGCVVYYFSHSDIETPKSKELTLQIDSLRRANKAITDSLTKITSQYHRTDSMLWVALNDTTRIKIKHEKIISDHAALSADSAYLLFIARFGISPD